MTIVPLSAPTGAATITTTGKTPIPLLINNKSVITNNQFTVQNPATNQVADLCVGATIDDAIRAVDSAKAAFAPWSKTTPYARRDILLRAADIMQSRKEELIAYQIEETGAGRLFSEKTFDLGVSFMRDTAGRIPSIEGAVPSVSENGETAMVFKEPYGVILGIAPWYVIFLCLGLTSLTRRQERPVHPRNPLHHPPSRSRKHRRPERLRTLPQMLLGAW